MLPHKCLPSLSFTLFLLHTHSLLLSNNVNTQSATNTHALTLTLYTLFPLSFFALTVSLQTHPHRHTPQAHTHTHVHTHTHALTPFCLLGTLVKTLTLPFSNPLVQLINLLFQKCQTFPCSDFELIFFYVQFY